MLKKKKKLIHLFFLRIKKDYKLKFTMKKKKNKKPFILRNTLATRGFKKIKKLTYLVFVSKKLYKLKTFMRFGIKNKSFFLFFKPVNRNKLTAGKKNLHRFLTNKARLKPTDLNKLSRKLLVRILFLKLSSPKLSYFKFIFQLNFFIMYFLTINFQRKKKKLLTRPYYWQKLRLDHRR
jgi:hypothetical protein